MKKILSLFAVLLCVLTVNAQFSKKNTDAYVLNNKSLQSMKAAKTVEHNNPSRIALESGERLMGYYMGDERGISDYALGFTDFPGKTFQVGSVFSENLVKPYIGGEITKVRFALWETVGSAKVIVYKYVGTSLPTPVATETIEKTVVGWNDVTLSTPVTIEEGIAYLVAYEFMQGRNKYMIATDYVVNPGGAVENGFVAYGDFEGNGNECWESMGTQVGNLLIQAVVKGGNFADYDITIGQIGTYGLYCKKGDTMNFQFTIKNSGNKEPESYSVKMLLDGEPIDADMNLPEQLTGIFQNVDGTFRLPADASHGLHTLTVAVDKINGTTPVEDTDDDEFSVDFNAFDKNYARPKQLVEQFTSTFCTYCPLGNDALEALCEKRGDIAWVGLHQDMGPTSKDNFTIPESYDILRFSTTGFPTASFNRMYIDGGSLAMNIAADPSNLNGFVTSCSDVLDLLNKYFYPSFASVDIASSYNSDTKKISVTVSGEKSAEDFSAYVGDDAVLTVYLTEDDLVAKQLNQGTWEIEYTHDNVLRHIATAPLGDEINWEGNAFKNDFEIDVDDTWKTENMHIVAFISRPVFMDEENGKFQTKINEAWVVNTNMVEVGKSVNISNPEISDANVYEVARYTIDGRKIAAPVKGLNLVKMSDGKTVKVIVK